MANPGAGVAASAFTTDLSDITTGTECSAQNVVFNTPTRTPTATFTATPTSHCHRHGQRLPSRDRHRDPERPTLTARTATVTGTTTATVTITPTPTPTTTAVCMLTPQPGLLRAGRVQAPPAAERQARRRGVALAVDRHHPSGRLRQSAHHVELLAVHLHRRLAVPLVMEMRAPAGGTCQNGAPCWKARPNGKGFRYRDLDSTPDGITRLVLRRLPSHLADLVVKARGTNIRSRTMPLTLPVRAQLVRSDGPSCWEATYSAPALKNTLDSYKDKND